MRCDWDDASCWCAKLGRDSCEDVQESIVWVAIRMIVGNGLQLEKAETVVEGIWVQCRRM